MKHQALFPYNDKSKKIKYRLLQFLFGALRVKYWLTILCNNGSESCGHGGAVVNTAHSLPLSSYDHLTDLNIV